MKVSIKIARSIEVPAPCEEVAVLLSDLEGTIRRFPKLKRLKKLGPMVYLWEMSPIGSRIANIAHEVSYAAHYTVDPAKGRLSWSPLPEHGNAVIQGQFQLQPQGSGTRLSFSVEGELRDVPVPLMYRLVAPPFIQGKFTHLVDVFLEKTRESLESAPVRTRAAARKK